MSVPIPEDGFAIAVVPDLSQHQVFRHLKCVKGGPQLRFFAGTRKYSTLRTLDGYYFTF